MLLMNEGFLAAVEVIITSLLGIFAMAVTLLYPGLPSDLLGLVLVGGVVLYQRAAARRAMPDAA
jgi:UPF0716 family protein affecting phage T7 exclusion